MLSRRERLNKTRDIQHVFRRGQSWRGAGIVVRATPSAEPGIRFAVVVSKKVAAKATRRNRIKRLLRQAIKEIRPRLAEGAQLHVVVVALPGLALQNLADAKTIVEPVFSKAGIVKK